MDDDCYQCYRDDVKVDVLVTDVTDDREGESNVILGKKDCFFQKALL